MTFSYQSLDDEINAVKISLESERELERIYYQNSPKASKEKIKGLKLEEETYLTGEIWRVSFLSNQILSEVSFLKNGMPVILESEGFSLVCQIYKSFEKTIILQYKGEEYFPDSDFTLSPWISESTYNIYFEAIQKISNKEEKKARVMLSKILGYQPNTGSSKKKTTVDISKKARVLLAEDYLLIFGPPGTGKTTLLVDVIRELRAEGKSVLALAPTNFACDYLVESCVNKNLNPVRLGISAKIGNFVQDFLLDSLIETSLEQKQILEWQKEHKSLIKKAKTWKRSFDREDREERKQLYAEAKSLSKSIDTLTATVKNRILDQSDVIVSTFVPAWNFYKEGKIFDYVIVDEATQGLEPAFYLALLLAEKIILVGDPKQLPPTLQSKNSILSETFLEKAIHRDNGDRTLYLDTQYRMPKEILEFSNIEFYENRINTNKVTTNDTHFSPFEKNLVWIDTSGSDAWESYHDDDDSCFNSMEADLIISLFEEDTDFSKIAILSPYRKQVQTLNSKFQEKFPSINPPLIQTIDSFQGREADNIILSFVRTNDEGEIGFLKDYKRLNVGLTRAKENLILVGNSATLSNDKIYDRLIQLTKKIGEYRSIFEFLY